MKCHLPIWPTQASALLHPCHSDAAQYVDQISKEGGGREEERRWERETEDRDLRKICSLPPLKSIPKSSQMVSVAWQKRGGEVTYMLTCKKKFKKGISICPDSEGCNRRTATDTQEISTNAAAKQMVAAVSGEFPEGRMHLEVE